MYNPRLVSDYVETFKHDPDNGTIVRQINFDENPFLSNTMLRKIERMKENDYEEYEHIYLGIPRNDDDLVVIKRSWIEAAIDAHIKLGIAVQGKSRIGYDVADSGKDLNSQLEMKGIVAVFGENWKGKEDELDISCQRVYSRALLSQADIHYDSIGVGAGCGPFFKGMNEARTKDNGYIPIDYFKFIAGAKVVNPDDNYIDGGQNGDNVTNASFFENLKAQSWWVVADRFRNTYNAVTKGTEYEEHELISISSDLGNVANLVAELSTPRRKFSKAGKVMVESKEDLAKRDIKSPNDADAFIAANAPFESAPAAMDLMFS